MRTAILLAVLALATAASAQSAPIATEHDRNWSKASTAYAYKLERNNQKHLHQLPSPVKPRHKDKTAALRTQHSQLPAAENGK